MVLCRQQPDNTEAARGRIENWHGGGIARRLCGLLLVLAGIAGCSQNTPRPIQGYVEGEFVYVASPLAGKLLKLGVQRGSQVKAGTMLFELEDTSEKALRDESHRRVEQAKGRLEDANKGKRPSEIQSLEAQLEQARAALKFSETELHRAEKLASGKVITAEELDDRRTKRDQDDQRIRQLEADLQTAKLGDRPDLIVAAQADVRALESSLSKADWDLSQKQQSAMQDALVFDTLYREGEWVPAGRPVVSLLPPPNIKVRAFVPEPRIGELHTGDPISVRVDGVPESFQGKVSYISPRAEYTPPVIYSQDTRSKLVFMIEIVFDPQDAAKLHPGQPVDVDWKTK